MTFVTNYSLFGYVCDLRLWISAIPSTEVGTFENRKMKVYTDIDHLTQPLMIFMGVRGRKGAGGEGGGEMGRGKHCFNFLKILGLTR